MKKELFAGVLLLVLIGLCAWNLQIGRAHV